MAKKVYKIEYGREHLGGTGIRGIDFHISRPMTGIKTRQSLKRLNKKFAYTTLFKFKKNKWEIIG